MKRIYLLTAVMAVSGLKALAQSTDARYPMGPWQTPLDGDGPSPELFVDMSIWRECENGECGNLTISELETDKVLFDGSLTYAGKEMKNGVPTGTYYFKVTTSQGDTCSISVNGSRKPLVVGTGVLKDHPALKSDIVLCPGLLVGSGGGPVAMYKESEKDLLDDLRIAMRDRRMTAEGFGNLQQYVNAHATLDPSKPKYAKSKGTGAVNIRREASTTAAKVAELKPGQTLLVTDELNGWCQVRLDGDTQGWVSLSVVTLTNTPSSAAAQPSAANDGYPKFLGVSMGETAIVMKEKLEQKGLKVGIVSSEGTYITLEGIVNGVQSTVDITAYKDGRIAYLRCFDKKRYSLAQARDRFKKVVAKQTSLYGKGKDSPTDLLVEDYEIDCGKGAVNVRLSKEAFPPSTPYAVYVQLSNKQ